MFGGGQPGRIPEDRLRSGDVTDHGSAQRGAARPDRKLELERPVRATPQVGAGERRPDRQNQEGGRGDHAHRESALPVPPLR